MHVYLGFLLDWHDVVGRSGVVESSLRVELRVVDEGRRRSVVDVADFSWVHIDRCDLPVRTRVSLIEAHFTLGEKEDKRKFRQ